MDVAERVRPPILVFAEQVNLSVYATAADVEAEVESMDVLDGIYEAFEADGLRLELALTEPPRPVRRLPFGIEAVEPQPVRLQVREPATIDREALLRLLCDVLTPSGAAPPDDLDELIRHAEARHAALHRGLWTRVRSGWRHIGSRVR